MHPILRTAAGQSVSPSRGEILTFPDTPTTQGLSLWCFNIVGGEILTIPDTPTTQGLSLWCFNIVGGEILTIPPDSYSHYRLLSGLLSRYGVINIAIGDKNNAIARSRGREWRVIHSHLLTHSTENTQHRRRVSGYSRGIQQGGVAARAQADNEMHRSSNFPSRNGSSFPAHLPLSDAAGSSSRNAQLHHLRDDLGSPPHRVLHTESACSGSHLGVPRVFGVKSPAETVSVR